MRVVVYDSWYIRYLGTEKHQDPWIAYPNEDMHADGSRYTRNRNSDLERGRRCQMNPAGFRGLVCNV